jgi:DNA-binding MurR/RpiR family transcriptional regulator
MIPPVEVVALIRSHRDRLTPAERRVADVVLGDPQLVAFGTVAELAERAGSSGATVVRLAAKLGLDGFSELQDRVQGDLGRHLRQATQRIRQPAPPDLLGRVLQTELDNVAHTLERADRRVVDRVVALLASRSRAVFVLASEAAQGVGMQFASELSMLRRDVRQLRGSEVSVLRALADARAGDVVVALDLPRYDRWLLHAARDAAARDAVVVALTDGELAPLGRVATHVFVVDSESAGPFDSYLGALAMLSGLVTGVAAKLRDPAAERLDEIEGAWDRAGALVEDE